MGDHTMEEFAHFLQFKSKHEQMKANLVDKLRALSNDDVLQVLTRLFEVYGESEAHSEHRLCAQCAIVGLVGTMFDDMEVDHA